MLRQYHLYVAIIDSGCEKSSEAELALSLVKEEIGHGSIDPIVAQKRALTVCKLEQLKNQLARTQVKLNLILLLAHLILFFFY